MNILLSTFGQTWQIVPELAGLVSPCAVPLYNNYPDAGGLKHFRELSGVDHIDEIWLILTNDSNSLRAYDKVSEWYGLLSVPSFKLRQFVCRSTSRLVNANECRTMTDYIMRVVLKATDASRDGFLLLSLAGGRKTMLADLQRAAAIFGCRLLFHVADNLGGDSLLRQPAIAPIDLTKVLPENEIAMIFPVVVAHNINASVVSTLPASLAAELFPPEAAADHLLLSEIEKREAQTRNLLHNAYLERRHTSPASYFHGLQLLPAERIRELERSMIGVSEEMQADDLAWLQRLPKADLHCHLGGVLDVDGLIGAALANGEVVESACKNPKFKQWQNEVKAAVKQHNVLFFTPWHGKWKSLRTLFPSVIPSTTVSAFLGAFQNESPFLDHLIFGQCQQPDQYCGIGIAAYEAFGDLQGSALLGNEAALRFTLQHLVRSCAEENITYCEVRCSPAKYASLALPIQRVIGVIREELAKAANTRFKLIIIASRHAPRAEMLEHVELVSTLIGQAGFETWFAGFDLAGDEEKMAPGELRDVFEPLLRDCVNVTIHAGETAAVNNIWEAAYMLNADRIGHGLTLKDDPRLMKRFADRGIAIEMCPSSNFQIVGFHDRFLTQTAHRATYPLRFYFDNNLTVTINTDNRGISRTTLSGEFLKAAQLTPGGLSKWEILQLIRNGFKSAFVGRETRKQLLLNTEEQLLNFL